MKVGLTYEELYDVLSQNLTEEVDFLRSQKEAARSGESPEVAKLLSGMDETTTQLSLWTLAKSILKTIEYNNEIISKAISAMGK